MIMPPLDSKPVFKETIDSGSPVSSLIIGGLNGDRDEIYVIFFNLYLANTGPSTFRLLPNSLTTNQSSRTHFFGSWSGSEGGHDIDTTINYMSLLKPVGSGWHTGAVIIHAKSGKTRFANTECDVYDSTYGQLHTQTASRWSDTTTNILGFLLQKTGTTTTFYGDITVYRKAKHVL